MKKNVIVSFLCVLILMPVFSFAQENVKQSLYLVHVDASSRTAFKQRIFAYHFLNGSFVGRDEVLSFDGRKEGKDYVRTDRGPNQIFYNRYLITAMGNIIDLKDKKVLLDEKASLVRVSNDSAIFYTNDIFKGKFYSVFDFKTKQYTEVKDLLFKPLPGRDIEFDKTSSPFKICYYPQGKPKVVLTADAGYGQSGTKTNFTPDPPLCWLNNDAFVFVNFNKANTEMLIQKMEVDTKTITQIGKLSIGPEKTPAWMKQVNAGELMLWYGNKQILIDLKASSVRVLENSQEAYGFSYAFKSDAKGRAVMLNGKEMGKFHFETRNFIATEKTAAFVKELRIGADTYQDGLMVWNYTKKDWEHVDADEVLAVVGWIRE
jgi:hypothetical protein